MKKAKQKNNAFRVLFIVVIYNAFQNFVESSLRKTSNERIVNLFHSRFNPGIWYEVKERLFLTPQTYI